MICRMTLHTLIIKDRLYHLFIIKRFILDTQRRVKFLGSARLCDAEHTVICNFTFMASHTGKCLARHECGPATHGCYAIAHGVKYLKINRRSGRYHESR